MYVDIVMTQAEEKLGGGKSESELIYMLVLLHCGLHPIKTIYFNSIQLSGVTK